MGQGTGNNREVLNEVKEGMTVYDAESEEIGEVDLVYLGTEAAGETAGPSGETVTGRQSVTAPNLEPVADEETWLDDVAEAFDLGPHLPEVLVERLKRHGFVRLEGGLFGGHRYIIPDQIASVSADGLHLNVHEDELIEERYTDGE